MATTSEDAWSGPSASRGDDERGCLEWPQRGAQLEPPGLVRHLLDSAGLAPLHAAGAAFLHQHVDDLPGALVAEELAQRLLVPGDAVALDQRDEMARGVAREGRTAEVGVLREEIAPGRVQVGEVAAPAPRDADLLADLVVVIDQHYAPAALPRGRGAHHAGRAGTDYGYVVAR